jgi:outer membrane lipase/esterase
MRAHCWARSLVSALAAFGVLALGVAQTSDAATGSYDALYVFGDSLSDAGNLAAATNGAVPIFPYYPYGRFSNGLNYADVLAGRLGVNPITIPNQGPALLPSLTPAAGALFPLGTNYAWGGALTGGSVSPLPASAVPTVLQQVGFYSFARQSGLSADPNALFVLWGGANDLRDAISYASAHPGDSFAKGDAVVKNAVDNIKQALVGLESQGAVTVLVPNLPDLGQIPETRTLDAADGVFPTAQYATALTGLFNADLDSMLVSFQGLSIKRLDVYSVFNNVLQHPVNYGLDNVTDPCFQGTIASGGAMCGTPDSYLFWDDLHPTARIGQILGGAAFAAAVPEPQTYTLFGIGLLIVGLQIFGRKQTQILCGFDMSVGLRSFTMSSIRPWIAALMRGCVRM